jgi:hypothetical protein
MNLKIRGKRREELILAIPLLLAHGRFMSRSSIVMAQNARKFGDEEAKPQALQAVQWLSKKGAPGASH